jgi:hypothetical protein
VGFDVIASGSGGRAVIAQVVKGSIEISRSGGLGDRRSWGIAAAVGSGYECRVVLRTVSVMGAVSVAGGRRISGVVGDGERETAGVVGSQSLPRLRSGSGSGQGQKDMIGGGGDGECERADVIGRCTPWNAQSIWEGSRT